MLSVLLSEHVDFQLFSLLLDTRFQNVVAPEVDCLLDDCLDLLLVVYTAVGRGGLLLFAQTVLLRLNLARKVCLVFETT
jgi:hypothetical protein